MWLFLFVDPPREVDVRKSVLNSLCFRNVNTFFPPTPTAIMPRDFNTIPILVSLFLNLLNSYDFQLYHEMAYLDVLNYLQMLQFQDFKLSSPLF